MGTYSVGASDPTTQVTLDLDPSAPGCKISPVAGKGPVPHLIIQRPNDQREKPPSEPRQRAPAAAMMQQQAMLPRLVRRRLAAALKTRSVNVRPVQRRWLTPAPKPGDGPMMSRRADRELPDIKEVRFQWRRSLPIFVVIVAACSVAIFNYQKMSSPVVSSTLYALRTSPEARALLGDEVYFKHQIPWIHGEMNQLQGRIDIWFTVRGTKATGTMRFASNRPSPKGFFQTTEWSLVMDDGTHLDLLDLGDPFKGLLGGAADDDLPELDEDALTRGFRKQVDYK